VTRRSNTKFNGLRTKAASLTFFCKRTQRRFGENVRRHSGHRRGSLRSLFGSPKDYERLEQTLYLAVMEFRSGHGELAASKTIEALKQWYQLANHVALTLDGTPDLKDALKSAIALADSATRLSLAGGAMGQHDLLIEVQGRLTRTIAKLKEEQHSARFEAVQTVDSGNAGTSQPTFDPSKLTPEEYEGWLRNQAIVRDATLRRSNLDLRLQELRRKAAQANDDLSDAEKQLDAQQAADTGPNSPPGDSLYPSAHSLPTNTNITATQSYQDLPNTSQWYSPRNYACRTGPCTLEEWQREASSTQPSEQPVQRSTAATVVPWCGAQWCAPRNYTCYWGPCTQEEGQKQNAQKQPSQQLTRQGSQASTSQTPAQPSSPPTERTQTPQGQGRTSGLIKATVVNASSSIMGVIIGGTADLKFTLAPGGTRIIDVPPGLNAVVIFDPSNKILPYDQIINFEGGKLYNLSYAVHR